MQKREEGIRKKREMKTGVGQYEVRKVRQIQRKECTTGRQARESKSESRKQGSDDRRNYRKSRQRSKMIKHTVTKACNIEGRSKKEKMKMN